MTKPKRPRGRPPSADWPRVSTTLPEPFRGRIEKAAEKYDINTSDALGAVVRMNLVHADEFLDPEKSVSGDTEAPNLHTYLGKEEKGVLLEMAAQHGLTVNETVAQIVARTKSIEGCVVAWLKEKKRRELEALGA